MKFPLLVICFTVLSPHLPKFTADIKQGEAEENLYFLFLVQSTLSCSCSPAEKSICKREEQFCVLSVVCRIQPLDSSNIVMLCYSIDCVY